MHRTASESCSFSLKTRRRGGIHDVIRSGPTAKSLQGYAVMRDVIPLIFLLLLHSIQSNVLSIPRPILTSLPGLDLLRRHSNSVISISCSKDLERGIDSLKTGNVLEFKTGKVRMSRAVEGLEHNIMICSLFRTRDNNSLQWI